MNAKHLGSDGKSLSIAHKVGVIPHQPHRMIPEY